MPFRLLQTRLADYRAVILPAGLAGEQRQRFVTKIAAAARQQANLAAACPGVLTVSGDVIERGDCLLIPHEPATPLDPAAVEQGERPSIVELWWVARVLLGALRAAAAENAPHGGIQTGSVFVDETGRLKLSDFGIAPVFEAVCGPEVRRQIHCEAGIREDSERRVLSGEWSLLPEEATREYGWIAPFFAHELLEGRVRLNPRSDQFAVGTLLYLLATGTHPYEAALSDPTLMFYFVLEPHPLEYSRPDWGEIFERRSKGLSQSADKPILAWSELVMRLLVADSSQRFANLSEAEKLIHPQIPEAWDAAAAALSQGQALLSGGDVEGCLARVAPWRAHQELPALWCERLTAWIDRISAQRELIVRRRELSLMLAEAQKHLEMAEASPAMALAQQVKDAPEAEESHRRAADEILLLCSDIEQLSKSEWASGYLDAAREYLARREFDEAREVLIGLLNDPGTPTARRAQARQLLTDVELAEQRIERQKAELAAARGELEAGSYESARARLEGLLSSGTVSPELDGESRALLTELQRREGVRARNLSVLAEGFAAWEQSQAELLEQKLAQVTSEFADPHVAARTAELGGRLSALRDGLAARREAEEALARLDADTALRRARYGATIPGLPAVLAEALVVLEQRGQRLREHLRELERAVEEEKQEDYEPAAQRIERLLEQADLPAGLASQARLLLEDIRATRERLARYADQLRAANAAWEAGDLPLLEQRLAEFTVAPQDKRIVQTRQNLVRRAERLRALLEEHKAAESALNAGELSAALAAARHGAQQEDLPQVVRETLADLQRRCEQLLAERRREAIGQALREIDAARVLLNQARVVDCRQRLEQALASLPDAPPEVRAAADELLATCADVDRAHDLLREVTEATARGEFDTARARLDRLDPSSLPTAVQEQLDQARRENERREADFRRGQEEALAEKIRLARVDLDAGRIESSDKRLAEVRGSPYLNEALGRLLVETERELDQLRPIAQLLVTVEKLLTVGGESELAEAHARLSELPKELPPWARERGGALRERSEVLLQQVREQRVQAAAAALDAAGEALERGDPRTARQKLEEARAGVMLEPSLAGWIEQLQDLAQRIESLLPKVQDLRRRLQNREFTAVVSEAALRFGEKSLPPAVARQLDELLEAAQRGIEQHRARLDEELVLLASELERSGRRARRFSTRAEAIRNDELATPQHREQAELLLRRYEALPRPKMPVAPLAVSGAVGLVAIGVILAWFGGGGGSGAAPGPPPDDGRLADSGAPPPVPVPESGPEPVPEFTQRDPVSPPVEQLRPLAERLLDELSRRLGEGFGPPALIPSEAGEYTIEVSATQGVLRVAGVRLDEQAGLVTPGVEEIVARFELQRQALAALVGSEAIGFQLDPNYDAGLIVMPDFARTAALGELCDVRTGRVGLTIPVRLRQDPRSDASFPLSGVFSVQQRELIADENGRASFRGYLKRLQELAGWQATEALRGDLTPPQGMDVTGVIADEPQQIELQVGPAGRALVTVTAPWHPERLAYQVDVQAIRSSLARSLAAAAASPETFAVVSAAWPALQQRLALPAQQAGRGLIEQLSVRELQVELPDPRTPFLVPVEVVLSGGEAQADLSLRLRTVLRPTADGLIWEEAEIGSMRQQIVGQLDALSRDEGLFARRQAAVLEELCREKGLASASLRISPPEGGRLKVEWTVGQTVHGVVWSWDHQMLRWHRREDLPPVRLAPPTLEARLERLCAQPRVEMSELAAVVGEVARKKLERYQPRGLEPRFGPEEGGDATGQLLAIGQALQMQLAPNRARDAFPTVFVEYFMTDDVVYGLSWHADADAEDRLVQVHRGRIWKVAPSGELLASTPEELRRRYSTAGERLAAELLAPALEGGVTASGQAGNGSFGVVIAPDGPLWMTRWEQVHIGSVAVRNLGLGGAPDPGTIHTLWEALKPQPFPYDSATPVARRRVGLWIVPTLGAVCREGAEQAEIRLERLTADRGAALTFRPRGEAGRFYAATVELEGTGDRGFQWPGFLRRLSRGNVGTLFWEYGWEGDRYEPRRVRSLVLLPLAP